MLWSLIQYWRLLLQRVLPLHPVHHLCWSLSSLDYLDFDSQLEDYFRPWTLHFRLHLLSRASHCLEASPWILYKLWNKSRLRWDKKRGRSWSKPSQQCRFPQKLAKIIRFESGVQLLKRVKSNYTSRKACKLWASSSGTKRLRTTISKPWRDPRGHAKKSGRKRSGPGRDASRVRSKSAI